MSLTNAYTRVTQWRYWTIQKAALCPVPVDPSTPRGTHYSGWYHHRLVLPVLELHMYRINQYALLCLGLLSFHIMLLRFIHIQIVVFISSSIFFFMAEYCRMNISPHVFIHSTFSWILTCFQFLAFTNKVAMNILL